MVDFDKLRQQKAHAVATNPADIFLRLPKSPGIDDLWSSQAETLKVWFNRRNDRDIVIKLNTGGGKTLVGLLIAQSIINENHGSVLYLCPTVQLVNQTLSLAKAYGIEAVSYERGANLDQNFLSGRCVMVATYAALFNALTRFGVTGGRRDIVRLAGIILDDAHTAFADMRDVFTLSIDSDDMKELYIELTQMFRPIFGELGRQGTFDDVVDGKDVAVLEIPYWSWLTKCSEVRERLAEYSEKDEFIFTWPLLRDCFQLCHALISRNDFSITAMYPLVDMFPSFAECPRRIYMSATVADDSSLIRTFNADIQSVKGPISPATLAGVGERLILTPELMIINRDDIPEIIEDIVKIVSKSAGVVILCPSKVATKRWHEVASFAEGSDVALRVQELVSRSSNGPFVFANRYDGIDLPRDSCRLLILSDLPRGSSSYDLYRATVFEDSGAIATTIAQRVEQGMGRGTRGSGDHCIVLLTGRELISWISRSANIRLLTATTRAQLDIGTEISKSIGSYQEITDTINTCLQREEKWTKYHADMIADSVSSPSINIRSLEAAECERQFFGLAIDGHYDKATEILTRFTQEATDLDLKLKGWLLQLVAHVAFLDNKQQKSDALQEQAYSINRRLLRPRVAPAYIPLVTPSQQSKNIILQLASYRVSAGFLARLDEVASWLTSRATSNQFEEALKDLGSILGYETQRPDHDYGVGPDVLWILDEHSALVISAKSRKEKNNPLTKHEHGQLLEDYEWFQQEYPHIKGYKVVIHPNTLKYENVTTADTFALSLSSLLTLVIRTKELITNLCTLTTTEAGAKCERSLSALDLTPDKITVKFLEPFHNA